MKKLQVIAAGLGYKLLERNGMTEIAGLKFEPKASVFPAVTCVAQASLRTGLSPAEHGMISNGYWSETLRKPIFWEQSCKLIKGERVWNRESRTPNPVRRGFSSSSSRSERMWSSLSHPRRSTSTAAG